MVVITPGGGVTHLRSTRNAAADEGLSRAAATRLPVTPPPLRAGISGALTDWTRLLWTHDSVGLRRLRQSWPTRNKAKPSPIAAPSMNSTVSTGTVETNWPRSGPDMITPVSKRNHHHGGRVLS
jgi:hypothetical protein